MQHLTLIPDIFNRSSWQSLYTNDIANVLQQKFAAWPKTAKIYHKRVSATNDVTPKSIEDIERLSSLQGEFFAVVFPEFGIDLIYYAYAIIAVIAIVAITTRPKIPNSTSRNYQSQSPNNALSARSNTQRVNGRIPDIYGTVRSTPDLLAVPYSVFVDNLEYEYCYMCIGRGVYDIPADQVRDGQTQISKITGESVEIFGPDKSPNTGDTPQLRIGDPITRPVISVSRSKSVNGQTLLAPNESANAQNYNNLVGFIYPNQIVAIPESGVDFTKIYNTGDLIAITTTTIPGYSPNLSLQELGVKTARFYADGRIEFDASTPLTSDPVGSYVIINSGVVTDGVSTLDFTGKYVVTGVSGNFITLQTPYLSNLAWNDITGDFGTFSPNGTITFGDTRFSAIDFNGTYLLDAVSTRVLTLHDPNYVNNNWVIMQGQNLNGGDSSFGFDGNVVTMGIAAALDNWIGPFVLDVTTMNEVISNFVAINGMYKDDGQNQSETDVQISLGVTPCDAAGVPTGPEIFYSTTVFGSSATQSIRASTLFAELPAPGRYMVRARRLTPKDLQFTGTVVDEVKWRDVYSSSPVGNIAFGNVTTVHAVTQATQQALAVSERQLNMLVTRMLPVRHTGNVFGPDLAATNSAADIISYISLDPKLGRRQASEVDFDNIYNTVDAITTYFDNSKASEFCYTFDNDNLSFEEMLATISSAIFCTAHRFGSVIRLVFEKQTEDSVLLFNHRNKVPGSEVRTVTFGPPSDFDGIEYDYVSDIDDAIVTYYVPEDRTATNANKIESVGIRNEDQAYLHAKRAYNKLLYQARAVEFDALQEAEILAVTDRILVADNTRPDIQDGQIKSQDGLILELSQPVIMNSADDYSIYLQYVSGAVGVIEIIAGDNPYHIVLAGAPAEDLITEDNETISTKTVYQIVRQNDNDNRSFLLTEKAPKSNFITHVTAVNYDDRYYQNDLDRPG